GPAQGHGLVHILSGGCPTTAFMLPNPTPPRPYSARARHVGRTTARRRKLRRRPARSHLWYAGVFLPAGSMAHIYSPGSDALSQGAPMTEPTPLQPPAPAEPLVLTAPDPVQPVAGTQAPAMAPKVDPAVAPALDRKVSTYLDGLLSTDTKSP